MTEEERKEINHCIEILREQARNEWRQNHPVKEIAIKKQNEWHRGEKSRVEQISKGRINWMRDVDQEIVRQMEDYVFGWRRTEKAHFADTITTLTKDNTPLSFPKARHLWLGCKKHDVLLPKFIEECFIAQLKKDDDEWPAKDILKNAFARTQGNPFPGEPDNFILDSDLMDKMDLKKFYAAAEDEPEKWYGTDSEILKIIQQEVRPRWIKKRGETGIYPGKITKKEVCKTLAEQINNLIPDPNNHLTENSILSRLKRRKQGRSTK